MKLTRSILGPIRATREGGAASFSFFRHRRRLRSSGSLKGGQASTFFTITGKKRGCALENPEPSSPKVTCIGQVRVKSKKKVKQCRRRIGEVSFRKIEQSHAGEQSEDNEVCTRPQRFSNSSAHYQQQQQQQQPRECLSHRDQRWVHLPISICEALRAFGAEFCCLFPCKCSCFSTSERQKGEKSGCCANEKGCGAVFARWLVAVSGGEEGKRREIEVVVDGSGGAETAEMLSIRSSRRHVFEDIEVKEDRIEVKGRRLEGEEEAARVSICIPPKNALLLMRCRSDPMKMAALANRFSLDGHLAPKYEHGDIEEENDGDDTADFEEQEEVRESFEGKHKIFMVKKAAVGEVLEQDVAVSVKPNEEQEINDKADGNLEELCEEQLGISSSDEKEQEIEEIEEALVEEEKEEVESNMSSFEALLDREHTEHYEDCPVQVQKEEGENPTCHLSTSAESSEEGIEKATIKNEKEGETEESTTSEKDVQNQVKTQLKSDPGRTHQEDERKEQTAKPPTELEAENQELVMNNQETKKEKESPPPLPECLLLMMCEPKLSMEVSKETWVRGADFIRLLPERPRKLAKAAITSGGDHEPVKRRPSVDYKSKPRVPAPPSKKNDQQPPRSSCSLPAASMAAMIEQKNAGACEPFGLTRCKSEPMSTAAAKLMPESCFWKNNAGMKLETHRQATLGVGAAGVGF